MPYNWSGTLTPSYTSGGFSPASRTYSHVTASLTSQNFTWMPNPVISGKYAVDVTVTVPAGATRHIALPEKK